MNTNSLIGLVALVVVIGGGAWYLSSHPAPAPGLQREANEEGTEGMGTYADLVGRSGSWTCQVSVTTPEAPAEGTTYISEGMVRADIVARPANFGGREISAHVIQTDGYIYSWSDMIPQGVKVAVAAGPAAAQNQGIDPNAPVQYSCVPWTVDASVFIPPTNVTFMEFSGTPQPQ